MRKECDELRRYLLSGDIIKDIDSTSIEDGKLSRRRRWFHSVTSK